MSDEFERTEIRISVPRETSGSEEDSYLRSGPLIQTPDYLVVVPLTDALLGEHTGINVRRLLQTAVALAADNDGRLLLLGSESVSEAELDTVREYIQTDQPIDQTKAIESIEERRTQLTQVADVAQNLNPDVSVTATVRAVTDITSGVLDLVDRDNETAVLLLRGAGLDEGWLLSRSTIDTLLADAECDVFVENVGMGGGENALYIPDVDEHTVASLAESEAETIDSILLPVDTGPHAALASETARAVARATGASITVVHVLSSDASAEARADGEDVLKFADYVLGSDVPTTTELREAENTADEIIQAATQHDFVSIGAPEQKSQLEQLVFESVQETISEQSEATVLMARDADRTMRSLYYRWKRGIEATKADGKSEN